MLAKEAIVTLDCIDGFRVVQSFGYVSGTVSRPHNMLRATFRSIGAFIGLAATEYLTEAERARGEALEDLRIKAEALGANAVVNLQFQANESPDDVTHVLAYGEAVVVERELA